MFRIFGSMNDGAVRAISGEQASAKVATGSRKGLQRAIALVESHHKKQEWIRGSKALRAAGGRLANADTDPHKLTVRTGHLLRSYTSRIVEQEMAAYYGSDVVYSRVHEFGYKPRNIPQRPGLQNTIQATAARVEKIMADNVFIELTGRDS